MKRIQFILFVFVICRSAPALEFRPFVQGSAALDLVVPMYSTSSISAVYSIGTYFDRGSDWEIGAETGDFNFYIGYRFNTGGWSDASWWLPHGKFDSHPYGDLYYTWESSSWKEKKLLVGGRWIPRNELPRTIKTVIGGAVSFGRSTLQWSRMDYLWDNDERIYVDYDRWDYEKTAGTSIGLMGEIGVLVRPKLPVDFMLTVQCHRWETSYTNDFDNLIPDHYLVVMPSVQLGVRYLLPARVKV